MGQIMRWSRRDILRTAGVGLTSLSSVKTAASAKSGGGNEFSKSVQNEYSIADRLGSNHVDSSYVFTTHNNLNEGAKRLQQLGSNVIKIWFHFLDEKYPYNSEWPEFNDIVDIARHEYLQELFARPFSSFVLVAYSFVEGDYNHYFREGVTDEQYEEEADAFYRLTKYLLREYRGTGKEFILQHWQGDWAILQPNEVESIAAHDIRPDDPEPEEKAIDGMIRWLNARQEGIERARNEVESDAKVFGATEVNLVRRAMRGQKRIIDTVVPKSNVDLVSHNLYRSMARGFVPPNPNNRPDNALTPPETRDLLLASLEYVQERTPKPSEYVKESLVEPDKNVFVGEYGFPAYKHPGEKARLSRLATDVSLNWGSRWVIYWQLYDNPKKGHWLIREDGSKTPTYRHMKRLIKNNHEPDAPSFTRVAIEYDKSESNRSFLCFGIDLIGHDGMVLENYNIGNLMDEPLIFDGSFWVKEVNGESCRWFGSLEDKTTLYFKDETLADVAALRFDGYSRLDDTQATILIDGESTSTVSLSTSREEYEVKLTSATEQPKTTESPTKTFSPTRTDGKSESTTTTQVDDTLSTTETEANGFGVLTTIGGFGTAWYLSRSQSEE